MEWSVSGFEIAGGVELRAVVSGLGANMRKAKPIGKAAI
jgi:hypothetical protein